VRRADARSPLRLVLTCEHASNAVPRAYAALFRGERAVLASHRGYDLGALPVARALARALSAPLHVTQVTRLLVDANRTRGHRTLFSRWSRELPQAERDALMARYHDPHWKRVRAEVAKLHARGARVVHVGVHSFTPTWNGAPREIDVGLLYDPARPAERAFCARWLAALRRAEPSLRLRRNAPYTGASNCLPTALRGELPASRYLGLELELNQALLASPRGRRRMSALVARALAEALAEA
jgi:predicted N-formylglutamate amidohydrolase